MEIRKQILGILIGIFITISFINPVYSYVPYRDDVCDMEVRHLIEVLHKVKIGQYYEDTNGWFKLKK